MAALTSQPIKREGSQPTQYQRGQARKVQQVRLVSRLSEVSSGRDHRLELDGAEAIRQVYGEDGEKQHNCHGDTVAFPYIRIYNKKWISASTQPRARRICSRGASRSNWRPGSSGTARVEDLRKDYGERRFQALGLIGNRLHVMVFTPWANKAHVISLRKANKREVKRYEAQV